MSFYTELTKKLGLSMEDVLNTELNKQLDLSMEDVL